MDEATDKERALDYFRQAYEHQARGEFDAAIALYKKSLEVYATAEAYTFLGWTYSFQGRYDEAIQECLHAISVDPDFGNPYNDIGAYLIEKGRWDEAIPWFERAIEAPRYEARCFPHFNLGRAYERKRDYTKALACYKNALREQPDYRAAREASRRLQAMLN